MMADSEFIESVECRGLSIEYQISRGRRTAVRATKETTIFDNKSGLPLPHKVIFDR